MAQWGIKDDKTSTGTVTLTAPTVTFNGASGHAAGVYTSAAHPFQLGDEVVYSNGGGTSVVGLTSASTYYVTEVASGTFMVATTEARALHNVPTPIVSTDGSGASHTFTRALAAGRGTIAGSSTLFTTEASTGDIIQVGSQEMVIITIASDTACTVKNNNQAALTVFSGQAYTLNEKPTSKMGGTYSSMNFVGIDGTEIGAGGDNVTSVGVTGGGARYLEAPAVTFSGGGGSSAAATASISGGAVSAIAVTNVGSAYTSAPTVAVAKPRRTIPTSGVTTGTDTFAYTAHGLNAGDVLVYNNGGGSSATGLTSGTTYYVIASGLTANAFKVSATDGGSTVDISGTGNNAQYFEIFAVVNRATAEASRGTGPSSASKGWVNRVVMTGANAGRIQYETLVALSSAASMSDAADDLVAPDA